LRIFLFHLLYLTFFLSSSRAANLEPEDIFFISSFSRPHLIAGNYRKVFIAGKNGVLIYNHLKKKWDASITVEDEILDIFYSQERDKLRILTDRGSLEYNENFRHWYSVDSLRHTAGDSGILEEYQFQLLPHLSGISMPYPWHFKEGYIRDKDMRWAPINRAVVFDYDQLWGLTSGLGIFKGSHRRNYLKPIWFGLEDPVRWLTDVSTKPAGCSNR